MSAAFLLGVTCGFIGLLILLSLVVMVTSGDRAEQKKRREKYEDEVLRIMQLNSHYLERQSIAQENIQYHANLNPKK